MIGWFRFCPQGAQTRPPEGRAGVVAPHGRQLTGGRKTVVHGAPYPPAGPQIRGDDMKEIALHILDIAQNSITARAKRVDITLEEGAEALTLTIADDGTGMSPELLSRVSDPFTTTRTTRKMGLGLPLLRLAAEQTGGSLTIESALGKGTTVTAVFVASHIDCPPLGDMAGTVTLLVQGAPELELIYTHRRGDRLSRLDTRELRAVLGPEVSLAEPEVSLWLRDYLQEQEALLRE